MACSVPEKAVKPVGVGDYGKHAEALLESEDKGTELPNRPGLTQLTLVQLTVTADGSLVELAEPGSEYNTFRGSSLGAPNNESAEGATDHWSSSER